jgi:D,D-heptose 1,7-bisphosphate phosphatase
MNKAIFLDKDGTLIKNIPYNVDPGLMILSTGVGSGLRLLQYAGFHLIVVSNQSGVAKGYFKEKQLIGVRNKVEELFRLQGVLLNGFYYCPHHPKGKIPRYTQQCGCRKPEPGMILSAANEKNIDLQQSWMIGDKLDDIEAGNQAGSKTILIDNGNETEWKKGPFRTPTKIVMTFEEAARYILKSEKAQIDKEVISYATRL